MLSTPLRVSKKNGKGHHTFGTNWVSTGSLISRSGRSLTSAIRQSVNIPRTSAKGGSVNIARTLKAGGQV